MFKRGNHASFPPSITSLPLPAQNQNQVPFYQLLSFVSDIFRDRWALKRITLVMFLGIGIGGVYYGAPLAVGTLGFNIYLAALLKASMKIP